jgi:hypothetical protein
MSNLESSKRNAKYALENIFKNKWTKTVAEKNKPILAKFKKAVNSASNKNKINSIVKSANTHKNNLQNMSHYLTNQGPGYGTPLKKVFNPHINMNNIKTNYNKAILATFNNNLNTLIKLMNRFKAIKAGGARQMSYANRFR